MRRLALVVLLCAWGCGAGNAVSGTVQGYALGVRGGGMLTHNTSTVFEQAIALTDFADTCGGTSAQANFTDLLIGVFDTSPLTASTYAVDPSPGPRGAVAVFGKASSCKSVLDGGEAVATGGAVTFSSLNAARAQGTFSLFFGQDTLNGSFDVEDCGTLSTDAGTAACN